MSPDTSCDAMAEGALATADWRPPAPVGDPVTLDLTTSPYVIRLPPVPRQASCRLCRQDFPARGPTGYQGDEPVCDHCLLLEEPHLGMVLALVAVVRMHAEVRPETAAEERSVQADLLAFARIYDRFASRLGPPRPVVDRARRESADG